MREILFKAKRLDNGEWVEGFLLICDERCLIIPETKIGCVTTEWLKKGEYAFYGFIEVDPATVGEFSGKRDKNDRRIFEGDIGRYRQTDGAKRNGTSILCTGKVIYNTETASYAVESRDEAGCRYFEYFPIKDFEVIGNISDNPELLEVEE